MMNLKICVINSCYVLLNLIPSKKEKNAIEVLYQEKEKVRK